MIAQSQERAAIIAADPSEAEELPNRQADPTMDINVDGLRCPPEGRKA